MNDLSSLKPTVEYGPWKIDLAKAFASLSDMTEDEAVAMIDGCGDECWREMWAEGFTPREAAQEEMSYWDDDGEEEAEQ